MHVAGIAPTLMHAEMHSSYLPWPENPHMAEARRVAESINRTKVEDPETGYKIYDDLVDSLVENTLALAKQYEHAPEPAHWTPPQRIFWRMSHIPYERRAAIVEDRSVSKETKAWVSINAGRWLVECQLPGCRSVQYASFTDRRVFCIECDHKAVDGQWLEVVWPEDHLAVEQWLESRPIEAKHWNPGETVDDIVEQDALAMGRVN